MKMIFRSRVNNSDFHNKGFCTKPRFERESFGTRKWPIFHTGRLQLNFGGIGVDYLRTKERRIEECIHVNQLVCLLAHNLVVVADCLVFPLLIFHFKFYFLTSLKSITFNICPSNFY